MRVLIVGSGFIGRAVAGRLTMDGDYPVLASRQRVDEPHGGWVPLDATDRDACARTVERVRPDAVVLVHGPSDVTWCESHAAEARRVHATAAENFAEVAGGRRVVLISTDNVFDGSATTHDETASPRPVNAYGRAKLAAEEALLSRAAHATVLRVSLVYGWEPPDSGKWLNFFAACAYRLRLGEPVTAPTDHWNTPVLLSDVADVTAAMLRGPALPLVHLGGPERISRAAWAALVAEGVGASPELVVPCVRAQTRYASRPANACLSSLVLSTTAATAGLRVLGVRDGTSLLLDHRYRHSAQRGLAKP